MALHLLTLIFNCCIVQILYRPEFFQAIFSLLLKQCSSLQRWLSYSLLNLQFLYMIFIYSQSFIHHFRGFFGINIMNSYQLACQLSLSTAPIAERSQVQIPPRPEFFSGLICTTTREAFTAAKITFIFNRKLLCSKA